MGRTWSRLAGCASFLLAMSLAFGQVVPRAVQSASESEGTLGAVRTVELASDALDGVRAVTTYLPPSAVVGAPELVVYAADGQALEAFVPKLEAAVLRGCLEPFIAVGVHSLSGRERWAEYTPGLDPEAFAAHAAFFAEEVVAWAERELGAPAEPARRVLFGVSNGADFVLELSRRQGPRFGTVVAFSPGYPFASATWMRVHAPSARYYLAAGTREASFHARAAEAAASLEELGAEVRFTSREAGHDLAMWQEEVVRALRWSFGRQGGSSRTCASRRSSLNGIADGARAGLDARRR